MNLSFFNLKYFIFERTESFLSCVATRAAQQLRHVALERNNTTVFTLSSHMIDGIQMLLDISKRYYWCAKFVDDIFQIHPFPSTKSMKIDDRQTLFLSYLCHFFNAPQERASCGKVCTGHGLLLSVQYHIAHRLREA